MALGRRTIGFIGLALLGLLSMLGLPPLQAYAGTTPTIGCGTRITQNPTLTSDVGPCRGHGLVVTANHVTLDLNGHRVFGTAAQGTWAGIRLAAVRGVTVKNGSVDNFDAGVLVFRGRSNTVRNLNIHDNNSTQFVADYPDVGELGDGVLILSSKNNTIVGNQVRDNGPFSGISVVSETENQSVVGPLPTGNVITQNLVAHNAVPDVCPSSGEFFGGPCQKGEAVFNQNIGIRVEGPGASFTTLSQNVVTQSGREGIGVLNTFNRFTPPDAFSPQNTDTLITDNNVSANGVSVVITDEEVGQLGGDGIYTRCFSASPPQGCATRTAIRNNFVTNNPAHGIALGKAQGNTVIGNYAVGNGFGSMTSYASDPPYTDGFDLNVDPPCDDNTWLDNTFGTVNQPCVRHHVGSGGPSTAAAAATAAATATGGDSGVQGQPIRTGIRAR